MPLEPPSRPSLSAQSLTYVGEPLAYGDQLPLGLRQRSRTLGDVDPALRQRGLELLGPSRQRGHVAALDPLRDATGYHVWNFGTGHPSSVLDVVAAYSDAAATEIPYSIMPRRPGDVAASYADPSKAQTELGWQAALGIQDACRDTYRWQQANPTGYKHT